MSLQSNGNSVEVLGQEYVYLKISKLLPDYFLKNSMQFTLTSNIINVSYISTSTFF